MKIAQKRSFSLVELLLSVSILSILVLSAASVFHTGILSYNRIDTSFDTCRTGRLILDRIALDLKRSFSYLRDDSKFVGDGQRMEFFTVIDLFDETGNNRYSICRIIYELDGSGLKRSLFKGTEALKSDVSGKSEVLAGNIKDIVFEYIDAQNSPSDASGRQDSWPKQDNSEQKRSRPSAIKIKLSLTQPIRRQGEKTMEFGRLVALSE